MASCSPNDQCDRVEVVLVSPRNPLNIGAAARAMANFGFSRLVVVAPYKPHWREAKSAVGAEELLHNRAHNRVAPGSHRRLHPRPRHRQPSPTASPSSPSSRSLLLPHPPGKNGAAASLSSSDPKSTASHATILPTATISSKFPHDPGQPSMNLGQAVAVCLYEIASRRTATPSGARSYGQR